MQIPNDNVKKEATALFIYCLQTTQISDLNLQKVIKEANKLEDPHKTDIISACVSLLLTPPAPLLYNYQMLMQMQIIPNAAVQTIATETFISNLNQDTEPDILKTIAEYAKQLREPHKTDIISACVPLLSQCLSVEELLELYHSSSPNFKSAILENIDTATPVDIERILQKIPLADQERSYVYGVKLSRSLINTGPENMQSYSNVADEKLREIHQQAKQSETTPETSVCKEIADAANHYKATTYFISVKNAYTKFATRKMDRAAEQLDTAEIDLLLTFNSNKARMLSMLGTSDLKEQIQGMSLAIDEEKSLQLKKIKLDPSTSPLMRIPAQAHKRWLHFRAKKAPSAALKSIQATTQGLPKTASGNSTSADSGADSGPGPGLHS